MQQARASKSNTIILVSRMLTNGIEVISRTLAKSMQDAKKISYIRRLISFNLQHNMTYNLETITIV